ncbi:unnamed protein product [Rhodiola kirilowii]
MAATNKESNMSIEETNQATLENAVAQPEIPPSSEEISQSRSEALSVGAEKEKNDTVDNVSGKVTDPISTSVSVDGGREKVTVGDVVDDAVEVPGGDKSVVVSKDVGVNETGGSAGAVVEESVDGKSLPSMEEEIPAVSESAGGLLVDPLDVLENVVSQLGSMEAAEGGGSQEKDSPSMSNDVEVIERKESSEPSSRATKKRKVSMVTLREQPTRSGKKQRATPKKEKKVKVPKPSVTTAVEKPETVLDEFSIDEEFLTRN